MNIARTTSGTYIEASVDPYYMTGPSLSKEEQIKRLNDLKKVKGKREKSINETKVCGK